MGENSDDQSIRGHRSRPRMYDIFEEFPDASVRWHGSVYGKQNALTKLRELDAGSPNRFFAVELANPSYLIDPPSEGEDH